MNQIQDARHDRIRKWGRTFRKAADKLIEKLLCRYLEMEGISTGLNEGVEERERRAMCGFRWFASLAINIAASRGL